MALALIGLVGLFGLLQPLLSEPRRSEWPKWQAPAKVTNPNRPAEYGWLVEAFEAICGNTANRLGAKTEDQVPATPLFVVAGACPTRALVGSTPMQAVMYFQCAEAIRFWWVKPDPDQGHSKLGKVFLTAQTNGEHKNLAGKSASKAYQPLVKFFEEGSCGELQFRVEEVDGCLRACIIVGSQQLWLYCVWQEEWSRMLAKTKFIKGSLAYQRNPHEQQFYMRCYDITDEKLTIEPQSGEKGPFGPEVLPSDVIKSTMAT